MAKKTDAASKTERAQAAIKAQEAAERRRKMGMIIGIVAALALIVGLFVMYQVLNQKQASDSSANPANATDNYGMLLGQDGAPHEVIVYEDFLCPACGSFEASTRTVIEKAIADGKVQVEYRPFELLGRISDYSMRSANAWAVVLDTAGADVAKKFHDELYANQPSESGPFHDDDWLIQKAVEAGADEAKIKSAIKDLKFEGWVKRANDHAMRDKVASTPTVRVDGKDVEGKTMDEVIKNFQDSINK